MPNACQNYIISQNICNKYQQENCNFFPTVGQNAINAKFPIITIIGNLITVIKQNNMLLCQM